MGTRPKVSRCGSILYLWGLTEVFARRMILDPKAQARGVAQPAPDHQAPVNKTEYCWSKDGKKYERFQALEANLPYPSPHNSIFLPRIAIWEHRDIREIFYLAHCEDLEAFPNTKCAGP
jgi:hypothetical protein